MHAMWRKETPDMLDILDFIYYLYVATDRISGEDMAIYTELNRKIVLLTENKKRLQHY